MNALIQSAKSHRNKDPPKEPSPADSHRRGWRERFHIRKKVQHGSAESSRADGSPRTPTPADSQAHSTGVQPDPHPSAHSALVVDNETPTPPVTVSLLNVDNLALVANIAEKIGNVVGKVPLVAPVAVLLSEIVKTYNEIKDMHDKCNTLLTRIADLANDLHGTIMRMEATKYVDSMGRLKSDIEEYVKLLRRASALTSDFDGHGVFKTGVNQKQWTDKFTALDSEFNSFAGRFAVNRITDVQIEQRGISNKLDDMQLSALEQKLEKWFQNPPDMKMKQHETQKLHHEGTGSWFLDSRQFSEWRDKSSSLWIQGQSGAGKSVLSSTVIKKLCNDQPQFPLGTAVAYFYFDFREANKQSTEIMLRSIIFQLSAQSPHPYSALDQQYQALKGQMLPTYQNLLDVLDKLLLELCRTYIILDALDECNDDDLLVPFILKLRGWTNSPLHLLVTSQPRRRFTEGLGALPVVFLELQTTESDITLFVSHELRSKRYLEHVSRRAEEITRKVVERSNGMFRLAACLLQEISRSKLNPDLDTILATLPRDLFGIYSQLLKPISKADFVYVATVLRWLLCSARPITMIELKDALAFNFSNPQRHVFAPDKRGSYAVGVYRLLEGLVTVRVDRFDSTELRHLPTENQNAVLSLAHASVADYILSDQFTAEHKYELREGCSHTFIAQSCVGYLLHFADYPLNEETVENNYPLSSYAAKYWIHHLLRCHDRAVLSTSTRRLLKSGTRQYLALNHLYDGDNIWHRRNWRRNVPSPLYMCSFFGYTEGVHFLLEEGADVNAAEGRFGNALQAACAEGHTDVVCLLFEKGVDVNAAGGLYGNALQAASARGHTDVVRLLLEKGADVNAAGGDYGNVLQAASANGRREIVCLLLENGVDINAVDSEYGSALQTASRKGHTDIVRLLLENGADVNAWGGRYQSALHVACTNRDTDLVRLLLEKGVEVNSMGGRYGSVLHAAQMDAGIDIMRLLLENGADVNEVGGRYGSALQAVCAHGGIEIVHLLLEKGADVNAAGGKYGSALQAACASGGIEIVRLLLEEGADTNAAGGDCGSALQAACMKGKIQLVCLLLEKGADLNVAGGVYGSALLAASEEGHTDTVRLLLEKGADINAVGGEYDSALQATCVQGGIEIVHLLLEKGINVNAAGGEYGSALQAASAQGHTNVVHLLLENGADVNAAGGYCGNALQAACAQGGIEIVRRFLEKGADINAAGGEYGSALQAACTYGHTDIVCLLLERGADANAAGGGYGSALQGASAQGHTDIVRLLLEGNGADVNAAGGYYGRALQAACMEGHTEIVRLLLETGADINAAGGEYGSALQAASANGQTDVVCLLLEKGADVNAVGGEYGSALQAASAQRHTDVVCLLLEKGADVNAVGGEYGSSLQAACVKGKIQIVCLLLEKGADVNAVGGAYGSALQAASVLGHTDVARVLLENGAIDDNIVQEERI
ncbi:ankyrin repeat-containing domain protein [Mycena epipterygia]|nr:ankyrin repeat-containing domain protein [Mycena epipterygia]